MKTIEQRLKVNRLEQFLGELHTREFAVVLGLINNDESAQLIVESTDTMAALFQGRANITFEDRQTFEEWSGKSLGCGERNVNGQ